MKLLLDTHAFLWLDAGSERIPDRVVDVIEASENRVYHSVASLWEIQIKVASGKLQLERPLAEVVRQQVSVGFHILPVIARHVFALQELPNHHRDPFDRILIAQAVQDDLTLVSCRSADHPLSGSHALVTFGSSFVALHSDAAGLR